MSVIFPASVAFISCSADDVVKLIAFFSLCRTFRQRWSICCGQVMGVAVITLMCSVFSLELGASTGKYLGFLGIIPIYFGIKQWVVARKTGLAEEMADGSVSGPPSMFTVFILTLSGCGNNFCVNIPLMANMALGPLVVCGIVFLFWSVAICLISIGVSKIAAINGIVRRYAPLIIMILFVFIGIETFFSSNTPAFLSRLLQ